MTTELVLDAIEQAIWTRQSEGHHQFDELVAQAEWALEKNETDTAIRFYDQALELDPHSADALAGIYGARVVDVGSTTMILEITAFPSKVEQFVEILRPFGIKEMLRTGRIAMVRGPQTHRVDAEAEVGALAAPEVAVAG